MLRRIMKSLHNKTQKPIRLSLPGGKTLFLGGLRQANVQDRALLHPPIQKLIEAGTLEVVEGAGTKRGASGAGGSIGGAAGHAARAKVQSGDR